MATTSTGSAATLPSSWRVDACPTPAGTSLLAADHLARGDTAPTLREIISPLTYALVDIWCRSYQKPPKSVVLDIDDTVDVVHGHQQLAAMERASYDERCFLPIHVYDAATGAPVVVIPAPRQDTVGSSRCASFSAALIGRIRRHWPNTRITLRGDGHYGRDEAMTWCREQWRRLHFWAPRQCRARPPGRACRR